MVPAGNKARTLFVGQPFRKNNLSSSSSSSSSSIHDRNRRALEIEMYKIYHDISPAIMNKIFALRHQCQYNLRKWTDFDVPTIRTVNHGSESVIYLGHKTWEVIETHIKELDTINKFKITIKTWKVESCSYKLYVFL